MVEQIRNWANERLEAVRDAKASKPLLLAAAAVLIGVTWSVVQNSLEGGMILGAPPWAWGLLLGFPLICWGLIEHIVKIRRALAPKVVPDFVPDQGGVVETREESRNLLTNQVLGSSKARFVRPRVECAFISGPKVCAAFLTRIERIPSGGPTHGSVAKLYDSIQLPWSNLGVGELPIHPGIPRHLDLMKAKEGENKLELCGSMPFTMEGFLDEPGDYLCDVKVIADGVQTGLKIKVTWDGNWSNLKAEKVLI